MVVSGCMVHLYCNASLKATDCRSKYCMASAKVQWRYRKTHGLGAVTYIDLTFEPNAFIHEKLRMIFYLTCLSLVFRFLLGCDGSAN